VLCGNSRVHRIIFNIFSLFFSRWYLVNGRQPLLLTKIFLKPNKKWNKYVHCTHTHTHTHTDTYIRTLFLNVCSFRLSYARSGTITNTRPTRPADSIRGSPIIIYYCCGRIVQNNVTPVRWREEIFLFSQHCPGKENCTCRTRKFRISYYISHSHLFRRRRRLRLRRQWPFSLLTLLLRPVRDWSYAAYVYITAGHAELLYWPL